LKSIQDKNVDIKDGNTGNLVTQTDKNIQNFIHDKLKLAFPSFKFMGEEEDYENVLEEELGDEPTWILDPIDGTTNFVHKFDFTVISLALCVEKEPVIGIIYCPVNGELFEATIGNGACLNGKKLVIEAEGLDLIQSLVVTEFGATGNGSEDLVQKRMNQITKLVRHGVHGIRMLGSAAYNLTRLATNSAQIYFEEGIHAWDVAAGALIVKEAGGVVSELNSDSDSNCCFRVNGRSIVACASRNIQQEFIKTLK
jgi:myo-inositol-1(or 4)-monophosphatase